MINVQKIETRLKRLDYTRPSPDRELLEELMKDGRSRILNRTAKGGLCELSDKYFEFCLSQVGSFCAAPYNAVEIGLSLGIQPIYIAAAIYLHGSDWQYRFLELKRFAGLDRGPATVWKSSDSWYCLGECQQRTITVRGDATLSGGQSDLRLAVRRGDMEKILAIAEKFPHRMMSILGPRTAPLYNDPRHEKSKRERDSAKKEAEAAGKKLVERSAFNSSIAKADPTIPRTAESYTTQTGRRYSL